MLQKMAIGVMTGVTEAMMPNIVRVGCRCETTMHRVLERIKLPRPTTLKKLTPSKI
jgi:hypothetical protein